MRKLSLTASVAGAVFLAFVRLASAEPGDVPTAVLGLEALEGVPEAVAAEITDALRQRIAATRGYQLVQGKDLVEVKLVFSCPDEAPACMSQAGRSMGANKLIFGNVKRVAGDYAITLKLLDVARVTVESWAAETVPKKRAETAVYRSLAPGWLATLTGKSAGGSLHVRANVNGAAVSLDGTRVGVTGADAVAINDVAPGHHEVSVEKSGYTTTKQEFNLAAGQSLPLSLALSPLSVELGASQTSGPPVVVQRPSSGAGDDGGEDVPADDGSSRTLSRVGFWVAVVGTVAAAGMALKFGNDIRQINTELDPFRRFECSTSQTGYCDKSGAAADPITDAKTKSFVNTKTDEGNRAQTLQWVCVGLLPPFAIAGAYFLYKGYLEGDGSKDGGARTSSSAGKRGARASRSTQSIGDLGLRIFPSASASAGGIIAEFDF